MYLSYPIQGSFKNNNCEQFFVNYNLTANTLIIKHVLMTV